MPIYTASYFEPRNHHGQLIAISHSIPNGFKVSQYLKFLAPASDILQDWQQERIDEARYIQRYRAQLADSWNGVNQWLNGLNPERDMTLLCWEKQGQFCHRNLVAKLVQKYCPECWGGADVLKVEMPICSKCSTRLLPGLDASYCPCCNEWLKEWQLKSTDSKSR